jgi:hypothetical protein
MSPLEMPPPLAVPAEPGIVTVRSMRMTHGLAAGLHYQVTPRTSVSFRGDGHRVRYQDDNLFGNESAGVSAEISRTLSRRTSGGITYNRSWFHQPQGRERTIVDAGSLSLTRALTEHMSVSFSVGRWWAHTYGQENVPLGSVLATLLDTPSIVRSSSSFYSAWTGDANLLTHWQWEKVNFNLRYGRSISINNLLGRPANTQSLTLNIGRQFGRATLFSASVSYSQSKFFNLQDPIRIDSGTARAELSRPLGSGLDFSIFADYSRPFRGIAPSLRFDHLQGGIRLTFHLPRVQPS